MIKEPHTYAEWVTVLDILKEGTDDVDIAEAMRKGTLEWQSGVAERFMNKLIDVINFRMDYASDRFQKSISRTNGEERVVIQSMLALRKEMSFLAEIIDLPAIPENERYQYKQLVLEQADNMQASLENSAQKDRSGKLLNIIKNHKINRF